MSVLNEKVLVLNKQWQALREVTVEVALTNMCNGSLTAIDTEQMRPVSWDDWLTLSVREGDGVIHTARLSVRVPTVVCASNFAGMPKRKPKLSNEGIAHRDGKVCQYSGEYAPDGNVDHVVPVSRGGARKSWENMVWSKRGLNSKKGNRLNHEAGLNLIRAPKVPTTVVPAATIEPKHPDWKLFLPE